METLLHTDSVDWYSISTSRCTNGDRPFLLASARIFHRYSDEKWKRYGIPVRAKRQHPAGERSEAGA